MKPPLLAHLARQDRAVVTAIDWTRLSPPEARRLRELGLDEGVTVEMVRPGGWLGGPLACRIGRMTVALRRHVALAVTVSVIGDRAA